LVKEFEQDPEFAQLRDTTWAFRHAAIYHPLNARSFLKMKAGAKANKRTSVLGNPGRTVRRRKKSGGGGERKT
jgi:hypothetical protein